MAEESQPTSPKSEEKIFSLEDLDKIIEAEDPHFKDEMDGIKQTGVDSTANIESLDIDEEGSSTKDELTEPEEVEGQSRKQQLIRKIKFKYQNFKANIQQSLKLRWVVAKSNMALLSNRASYFIRHELPERARYLQSQCNHIFQFVKQTIYKLKIQFTEMTRAQKIAIVFMLFVSVLSLFVLSRSLTGHWLPRLSDPLLKSFESEASFVHAYKGKSDMKSLFQVFPEAEYFVLLTKVIVNLKPDENSGRNPMGLFEMYIMVDTQDTAIEVKDREREIMDLAQRSLEFFTYSEANSLIGKTRMKSAVREEVNKILNQGRVLQIFFNSFVISP